MMNPRHGLLLLLFAVPGPGRGGDRDAAPGEILSIGPSYRIRPGSVSQTEPFLAVHPGDRRVMFASANTINLSTGFISEGVYLSTDGGATWSGKDTCTGPPVTFHRGDPGIAVDTAGTFILIRLGFSPGLYAHYSTDRGAVWSGQRTVASEDQDRAALVSDGSLSSTFAGRTYAAWVRFSPPYPVLTCFTADGGRTWSTPAQVNAPVQRGQGADLAVGSDGTLFLCWAGVIGVSPFTEDFVGFARSTDGGLSWAVTESAFDMNGIQGILPQKANIRVNGLPRIAVDRSGGPHHGWIYIVTTQKNLPPAGSDPDVILRRSTDGGLTWSGARRVHQDPVGNGKIQFFPAVCTDSGGGVNVLYYDDRRTTSDSTGVFLSRSTDGGDTWTDYEAGDRRFRPQAIGGLGQGYQGDNIAIAAAGDTLRPLWMDNSTGLYQIWTSTIRISSLGTGVGEETRPSSAALIRNYPNPFNSSTTLGFHLEKGEDILLEVLDVSGRRVALLAGGYHPAGFHAVPFDGGRRGLASGVYLARLVRSGGASEIIRMLLLR
ncbi:MAG: hypothetical protein WB626_06630 [Bacteroidota bacterium]